MVGYWMVYDWVHLMNWLLQLFFSRDATSKYRTELIESMGKDYRMQITHGDLISEHAPKCRSNDSKNGTSNSGQMELDVA